MQYDSEIQNHKQVFVLCSVQDATCKFHKWQLSYFSKLPKTVIDVMKLQPYCCIEDMSDEELANQTESFRELYALVKFVDDKGLCKGRNRGR